MITFLLWPLESRQTDTDVEGENVRSNLATGAAWRVWRDCSSASIRVTSAADFSSLRAGGSRATRSYTRVTTLASLRFGAVRNGSPLAGSTMSSSRFWSRSSPTWEPILMPVLPSGLASPAPEKTLATVPNSA